MCSAFLFLRFVLTFFKALNFLRFGLTFFNIVKGFIKQGILRLKMLSNSPDVLAGRHLTQSAECDVTHRLAMTVFAFCGSASFHNDQITFATLIISGSNGMAWNAKYRIILALITFQSWGLTKAHAWPPQIPWVQYTLLSLFHIYLYL